MNKGKGIIKKLVTSAFILGTFFLVPTIGANAKETVVTGTVYHSECGSGSQCGCRTYRSGTHWDCVQGGTTIAVLRMEKSIDENGYTLNIDSTLPHATITSYSWKATATLKTLVSDKISNFSSTAQTVNVVDYGTYSCTITLKDTFNEATRTITLDEIVADFMSASITPSVETSLDNIFSKNDKSPVTAVTFSIANEVGLATQGCTYQWYWDGEKIEGATDKTYTAKRMGTYWCVLTSDVDGSTCTTNKEIAWIGEGSIDWYLDNEPSSENEGNLSIAVSGCANCIHGISTDDTYNKFYTKFETSSNDNSLFPHGNSISDIEWTYGTVRLPFSKDKYCYIFRKPSYYKIRDNGTVNVTVKATTYLGEIESTYTFEENDYHYSEIQADKETNNDTINGAINTEKVTLSVIDYGTESVSYQWYQNGIIMDGETSSTLEADYGVNYYSCVTTDANGLKYHSEPKLVIKGNVSLNSWNDTSEEFYGSFEGNYENDNVELSCTYHFSGTTLDNTNFNLDNPNGISTFEEDAITFNFGDIAENQDYHTYHGGDFGKEFYPSDNTLLRLDYTLTLTTNYEDSDTYSYTLSNYLTKNYNHYFGASIEADKETSFQNLTGGSSLSAEVDEDTTEVTYEHVSEVTLSVVDNYGITIGSYQWYCDNNPIEGANEEIYTATEYGTYYCEITDTSGTVKAKTNAITCYIGSITLEKQIEQGKYKIAFTTVGIPEKDSISFTLRWIGKDSDLSVHLHGANASDVTGLTDTIIEVPDFGIYQCVIKMEDTIKQEISEWDYLKGNTEDETEKQETVSGGTRWCVLYYNCDDFDIEAPKITSVTRSFYEGLDGSEFTTVTDDSVLSERNSNNVVGFEDANVEVTVGNNVITPYEVEEEVTFYISDNMTLNSIKCVESDVTYEIPEEIKVYNEEDNTCSAVVKDVDLGLTSFNENGTYHFVLLDMLENEYDFTLRISKVDDGSLKIASVTSTPSSETLSHDYVLKASVEDSYSQPYYQFIRKETVYDKATNESKEVETIYKDWSTESFCEITDNGAYKIKVANSSLNKDWIKNGSVANEDALKAYDSAYTKYYAYNNNYDNINAVYSYCDTEAPSITDFKIKATSDMLIVTITASDNYSTDLVYGCEKAYKQKDNVFYITTNGTYVFTITDECGNTVEKEIYLDLAEYDLKDYGIIKDIAVEYLGNTYKANGKTYSDTGANFNLSFLDDVNTSLILTKLNESGTYANKLTYKVEDNGTYTIFTRNTELESEYVPEVLYKDTLTIDTIDKTAPTISIETKEGKAYITATDDESGIGTFNVTTKTIETEVEDNVDYSSSRKESVTYVLPLEYNVVQTIYVTDNVGNRSKEYAISSDGVIEDGFDDLFVVVFTDSKGNVISEQILLRGANAVAPEVPEKDGYTFESWSCDFTNVTSNLTVYPYYKNNATNEIDKSEVKIDESWHIALLGHTFAYSVGGDSVIDNLVEKTNSNDTITLSNGLEENREETLETINLSDYQVPLAKVEKSVCTVGSSSIALVYLIIFGVNKIAEKRMLKKERR